MVCSQSPSWSHFSWLWCFFTHRTRIRSLSFWPLCLCVECNSSCLPSWPVLPKDSFFTPLYSSKPYLWPQWDWCPAAAPEILLLWFPCCVNWCTGVGDRPPVTLFTDWKYESLLHVVYPGTSLLSVVPPYTSLQALVTIPWPRLKSSSLVGKGVPAPISPLSFLFFKVS